MSRLLTQNSELRPLGIHNWTLPAWVVRLDDGRNVNVCPQAGACVKLCYARNGSYRFPGVQAAHQRNLKMVMDNLSDWTVAILDELNKPRFKPKGVPWLPDLDRSHLTTAVADLLDQGAPMIRIHDSGDFFSDEYLAAWVHIATLRPDVLFYAYSKEVSRIRRVASDAPDNFLVCFSLGGKEDHLLDLSEGGDRHADVFPTEQDIEDAGYYSQEDHDLLCVVSPSTRVGIPTNHIKHFQKRQGRETFGSLEAKANRHHRENLLLEDDSTARRDDAPIPGRVEDAR